MLAVAVSRADAASEHVGEHLLDIADWDERTDDARPDADGGGTVYGLADAELRTVDARHLETEGVAAAFDDPDLLVFPSRHAGDTGRLLTAHHTGNFGPAEYGGDDGALARAAPNALRRIRAAFVEHAPPDYEVEIEATHHGPSHVGVPSLFAEVGSAEAQWRDPEAARAVARAILDLRGVAPDAPVERSPDGETGGVERRHLVGFGGGHYAPRFDRLLRESDWGVGHVAADWALDDLGDPREHRDVIDEAFERSAASAALVEGDRPALCDTIADLGHRVVGETWVRETTGVPLPLVDRLEDALGEVDDGVRFGEPARRRASGGGSDDPNEGRPGEEPPPADAADAGREDVAVVDLPTDLLAEARGADRAAVRDRVAATALAFDTEENGTRVVGPVALPVAADRRSIVEGLAELLARKYDDVTVTEDAVVARTEAFDPDRARQLGVPEGPKFGRLSAGEPVEVDDETVAPADVTTERERRFEL